MRTKLGYLLYFKLIAFLMLFLTAFSRKTYTRRFAV